MTRDDGCGVITAAKADGVRTDAGFPGIDGARAGRGHREIVLSAKGVCKSFAGADGEIRILSEADIFARRGELVSVCGKSGSGKSTLLGILSGFMKADSGSVILDGIDVMSAGRRRISELRNRKMGFVFQDNLLMGELSVFDNIMLPAEIYGKERGRYRDRAMELADLLGISCRLRHKASETSGGERARTAIARALIMKPSLCFLDEPTGALDNRTAGAVEDLIISVAGSSDTAFVYVTHDLSFATRADRRYEIREGVLSEIC